MPSRAPVRSRVLPAHPWGSFTPGWSAEGPGPDQPGRWHAGLALLPEGLASDVALEVVDGRFATVRPGQAPHPAARRLPGVVLPGLANCHSHAFHRALRGRTHDHGGTFWTWRRRMYALAARLDPDSYLHLARAAYAEMALAGISTVGEFHYLHHAPGGRRYQDRNAMAQALTQAAADAGVRLTLIDACYLAGGLEPSGHVSPTAEQRMFSDSDVDEWAARVTELTDTDGRRIAVAAHSVRAVPRAALPTIATVADGRPLHVHLSEQPEENAASRAAFGRTPTELLDEAGILGPATTAVHATHLTATDIGTLGRTRTTCCLCPSTEADLADGIGPARALLDAGAGLSLGSDQHALTDLLAEARSLEMHERLACGRRGRFTPGALLDAATRHDTLGWPDAGRLAVGARADLVAVRLDSPRTAGTMPEQIMFTASAADVDTVVVDGRTVVAGGAHRLGDVGTLLTDAIAPLGRAA